MNGMQNANGNQNTWRPPQMPQDMQSLSMNTLNQIPTPAPGATNIIALVKQSGRVVGYQLSDGRVLSKADGIQLAKQGGIVGVGIANRKGSEYLKSLPDGAEQNNLSSLPSISMPQ